MLSVYDALYPIYSFVRIFGLAPYTVEIKNKQARWRVSKLSLLYNVFFFIVVLMCLIPLSQHIRETFTEKLDKLEMYSDFSRRVSIVVICLICVTLSLVNRHKTCKLMKNLNDFDLDLMSHGIKLNHGKMRKKNIIFVVVMCSLLSISVAFDSAVVIILENTHPYRFASSLVFIVYYSTLVQFVGFVLVLQRRFAILNKYVISLNDNKSKTSINRNRPQKEIFNHSDGVSHPTIMPRPGAGVSSNINAARATEHKSNPVSIVSDFHDRLCEWGISLNSLYSIQIFLSTGIASIVVVVYLYIFYLMLSWNEKYEFNIRDCFRMSIWGLWFFSMIFGTSYSCARTRCEANKISALLHQIHYDKNDEETKTYIEMFSLQMLHQKMDFSAGGFFLVDLCSLRTIVASIITYLVLFIQFEVAARSKRTDKSPQ